MSTAIDAKNYWDRAARQDAAWYTAERTDLSTQFFDSGSYDVDDLLGRMGVHITEASRVLEIGSGVGRMTKRFAERAGQVIAADVSAEMLKQAAQNLTDHSNVTFLELSGDGNLPIPSGSIDIAFSYITMQHVETQVAQEMYFTEALRVIRPGGWVVMQFRGAAPRQRFRALAAQLVHRIHGKKTLSRAWRGTYLSESTLRAHRSAEITVDVLRLDAGHIWALARRRRPLTSPKEIIDAPMEHPGHSKRPAQRST